MRVTQLEISRNFLADIEQLNRSLADINRQLSSTKKLNTLSDSPFGSASLVDISEQAQRLETYRFNITSSSYQLKSAESALNAVNNAFVSIHTLGMRAANEPMNAESRQAILDEIENIREELISRANTQVDGRFLFAGSSVGAQPFVLNTATDTVEYHGNGTVNRVPVGDSVQVVAGVSGDQFYSVFEVVDGLIAAIKNSIDPGNPGTIQDIGAVLDGFSAAMDELGQARGQLGVSISMTDRMQAMLDSRNGVLREQRSHIEDANIAEIATRIGQLQLALNAAMSAGSVVLQQNNLFDVVG